MLARGTRVSIRRSRGGADPEEAEASGVVREVDGPAELVLARGTPVSIRRSRGGADPEAEASGVVREVDGPAELVLVQLNDGLTTWAFREDCSVRECAASPPPPAPAASAPAKGTAAAAARHAEAPPDSGHDVDAEPGLSVGTLRYSKDHKFPPLDSPVWAAPPRKLSGWRAYFDARLPPGPEPLCVEPSLIDGLSYPLSFIHAWREIARLAPKYALSAGSELTIVLLGASVRAEERLLHESSYWLELVHFFPACQRMTLLLTGLEVSAERHGEERSWHPRLRSLCFRGKSVDALRQHACDPASTVLVGFNTGCGSGIAELMCSWAADMRTFAELGYLQVYTCANDYSDLRGELELHKLLRSRLVLPATEGRFPAMTIVKEPGDRRDEHGNLCVEWSRSSAFLYAVRGFDDDRPASGSAETESAPLLAKVRELADRLRRTQRVSPVP